MRRIMCTIITKTTSLYNQDYSSGTIKNIHTVHLSSIIERAGIPESLPGASQVVTRLFSEKYQNSITKSFPNEVRMNKNGVMSLNLCDCVCLLPL